MKIKKVLIGIAIILVAILTTTIAFHKKAEEKKSMLPILGEYELSFFTNDTIHYQVAGTTLINEKGERIENILNTNSKIKTINFFFSTCPSICPIMNKNLNYISAKFNDYDVVINSISIDPVNDSPQKLLAYRTKNKFNNENWIFYTGQKRDIFTLAGNCKLKAFEDDSQDNVLVHDPTIMLLDDKNQIRGYYNSLEEKDILKLEKDIYTLIKELS